MSSFEKKEQNLNQLIDKLNSLSLSYSQPNYEIEKIKSEKNELNNKKKEIEKQNQELMREHKYLKEKNIVREIIVYEREIQKDIINSEDFVASARNVIICMSQDALKSLCNHYHEIIKRNETFLIVPNDRFMCDEIKIFNKVFTLKSSEYQKEILNIIQNN